LLAAVIVVVLMRRRRIEFESDDLSGGIYNPDSEIPVAADV
jgi:hypothetical protein